jgi:hypothetical protein
LIKGGHGLHPGRFFMQTMTAFDFLGKKVKKTIEGFDTL